MHTLQIVQSDTGLRGVACQGKISRPYCADYVTLVTLLSPFFHLVKHGGAAPWAGRERPVGISSNRRLEQR